MNNLQSLSKHFWKICLGASLLGMLLTACRPPSLVNTSIIATKQTQTPQRLGRTETFGLQSTLNQEPSVSTYALGGGHFNLGFGLSDFAVAQNGFVYVTDYFTNSTYRISPSGEVSTFASVGGTGMAVDANGFVYIADRQSRIQKISPDGIATILAGQSFDENQNSHYADGMGSVAKFYHPRGLAVDVDGCVYVADVGNNCIRKISPSGLVTTFAGTGGNGDGLSFGDSDGLGSSARFYGPVDVDLDTNGYLYVAEFGRNRIRKISPSGVVTTLAGGHETFGYADGIGSAAKFGGPTGIAVDASQSVYIADYYYHRIRKISPSGLVTTFAGTGAIGDFGVAEGGYLDGPVSIAKFFHPIGVAVDANDCVYVADLNNAIRKITQAPAELKLALSSAYISPNNDGAKDATEISITASGNWKLSVAGQGGVFRGSGNQAIQWNGIVDSLQLPDGEYTLKLEGETPNTETEATVSIDTVPPEVDITADGKGNKEIVDSILPKFAIRWTDGGSGVSGPDDVKLRFAPVDAAYTPLFDKDALTAGGDGRTFTYQPPFREECILYPGDQWVAVDITDKAGNLKTAVLSFAVGGHSKYADTYSGVPPVSSAYRAQGVQTPPQPVRLPPAPPPITPALNAPLADELRRSSDAVIKMNPVRWYKRFRPSAAIVRAPVYAVLRGANILFACLDLVSDSVMSDLYSGNSFRIDTRIGTIVLSEEQWNIHILGEGQHPELGKDSTFLATIIKQMKDENARWEDWAGFDPEKDLRKLPKRRMLVIDYQGRLYIVYAKADPHVIDITTAFGAAVFKGSFPSRAIQWSFIADRVCHLRKGGSPNWQIDNDKPEYRKNLAGDIIDQEKPYRIEEVIYTNQKGETFSFREGHARPDSPIYRYSISGRGQ